MSTLKHYERNKDKYVNILEKLARLNKVYLESNLLRKKNMLLDSYAFAAISVQTSLKRHEDAWRKYMVGKELDVALKSVNYNVNKSNYIQWTSSLDFKTYEDILNTNNIDKKHKKIIENFKGVSTVKSAFVLSMLGFTQKACMDANLLNFAGIDRDKAYTGVRVDKYNKQCEEILSTVKPDHLPIFMKQWLAFNYERDSKFADHSTYFDVMFNKYEV